MWTPLRDNVPPPLLRRLTTALGLAGKEEHIGLRARAGRRVALHSGAWLHAVPEPPLGRASAGEAPGRARWLLQRDRGRADRHPPCRPNPDQMPHKSLQALRP